MDISQLSAKQKRYREWKEFLNNASVPEKVKKSLEISLNEYGRFIVQVWDAGTITTDDDAHMQNIERQLEMLNDSVRLLGAKTMGREFNK